ncbi:MAG: SpoIIE family protein phosphatase [Thermoanaerobaculia bacterium]
MSLRVRLAVAFFLLSALPLTALAIYSYTSSSRALRRAVEAEAQLLARDLETRMDGVAARIDRSFRTLGDLPARVLVGESGVGQGGEAEAKLLARLGDALPFLEQLEFVPRPAEPPAAAAAPAPPAPPPAPASPAVAALPAAPAAPPAPPAEVDVARIVAGASRLAGFAQAAKLTPGPARDVLARELAKVQKEVAAALAVRKRLEIPPGRAVAAPAGEPAAAPGIKDSLTCPLRDGDQVVGELRAKVNAKALLQSVLAQTHRDQGEIPFAMDGENRLFVARAEDGDQLRRLPNLADTPATAAAVAPRADWVMALREDRHTGLRFGIARPLHSEMAELKRATARNFGFGLGLVGLAVVGMVPLSSRMVRTVRRLEESAARLAEGDLEARVPVTSNDEFGRLARTFNHMAAELRDHQAKLLAEERLRKEREVEGRLLSAENDRKSRELEQARSFQLSLLPRELPRVAGLEIAVAMTTATEVGGDYYDFQLAPNGELVVAIGDATGHGAAAGTMVTAVKSLFLACGLGAAPAAFLAEATRLLHRMGLVRMAMALAVARFDDRRVTFSSAAMPPLLHYRAASGETTELALAGTPLGTRAEYPYQEVRFELAPGDVLLLASDGFAELPSPAGEPLGYERARERFAQAARGSAEECLAGLARAAREWSGDRAPSDDMTFLVLRATR